MSHRPRSHSEWLFLYRRETEINCLGDLEEKRVFNYIRHFLDYTNCISTVEGKLNGKRGRDRPRTLWMDNIKEWTKLSYVDCVRKADDRERWKSMIVNLLGAVVNSKNVNKRALGATTTIIWV